MSLQELFALIKDEYEHWTGRLNRTQNGATGTNMREQAFIAEPHWKWCQLDDKCNACGGASYYARNCSSVGKLMCGNSHSMGHLQKDCFLPRGPKHDPKCWKGKKRKKQEKDDNAQKVHTVEDLNMAFVTTDQDVFMDDANVNELSAYQWITDTSATTHVTSNRCRSQRLPMFTEPFSFDF